jgi:hypothetical protein
MRSSSPLPPPGWHRWAVITIRDADGSGSELVLGGPGAPDVAAVDRLARILWSARRSGGVARVEQVSPEFAELLRLCGLEEETG